MQRIRWPRAQLKPKWRIKRLGKRAAEGVEGNQFVRWDCVERQSAGMPVQIHRHSAGADGRLHGYDDPLVFVARLRIYHGTAGSRTHRSDQSSCRGLALSFWFSCRPHRYSPSPPSPPPSNIAQSTLLYTAPDPSGWTSVGGLGTAAPSAPPVSEDNCCPQTEPEFSLLYSVPVWVCRHLREKKWLYYPFISLRSTNRFLWGGLEQFQVDKNKLTLLLACLQPLNSALLQTEDDTHVCQFMSLTNYVLNQIKWL